MNKNTVKSIGAIIAGFLIVVILSVGTDVLVESIGILPPATQPEAYTNGDLLIALIYRTIYTIAAGYVTALLAPNSPMKHVMILGILGTLAGIGGIFASMSLPTGQWYAIALAVLAYPSVWLGGKLRVSK